MMKKPLVFRAVGFGALALTVLAALLRSLAFATSFDRASGYFDPNVFSTLLYIVIALALAGVAIFAWFAHRIPTQTFPYPTHSHASVLVKICSWVVALVYTVAAVSDLLILFNGNMELTVLIRAIAAVLAIPYFLFPASSHVLSFGLAAHAYCLSSLISEYFDLHITMNSPLKLMQQFSLLIFMLYLLWEIFATIRPPRPIRTAVFGLLTVFLCITNGASCIVAGVLGAIIPFDYLLCAIVLLALGLYTAARLYTAAKHSQINETEAV